MLRATTILAACALLLPACHDPKSAGSSGGALQDFRVLAASPTVGAMVFLNDPVKLYLSQPVDLDSADLNSVRFEVFDRVSGERRDEPVRGRFQSAPGAGGARDTVLVFEPELATRAPYVDGGLRPRRRYVVSLLGAGPALRDQHGRRLVAAPPIEFTTVDGDRPGQLFRDALPGGPRVVQVDVWPSRPGSDPDVPIAPLNLLAHAAVAVRIQFDQPLDPGESNLPRHQSRDPLRALERPRGLITLEYDDPERGLTWIPAVTLLERNEPSGAEVTLAPDGVLPNNARVRVVVDPGLADLSGQSNAGATGYQPVVARFATEPDHASQFDAVRIDFDQGDLLDHDAVFPEPLARVANGALRAAPAFDGVAAEVDFAPGGGEVLLNTDTVPGGVFRFRHVTIPRGTLVRGMGRRPLSIVATGEVRVEGTLAVVGGDGAWSPDPVTIRGSGSVAGGLGTCGGGRGGNAAPNPVIVNPAGEDGAGPGDQPHLGGAGGLGQCARPAGPTGGSGGSHTTQGDPHYLAGPVQRNGGDQPGPVRGRDGAPENDFVGAGVDLGARRRILGEFADARGGAGGGGGGDGNNTPGQACGEPSIPFRRGGGGGAGGGALTVQALGTITVGPQGRITADGGHGHGGAQRGANSEAGGGGGGAGGTVILMSASGLVLHRHGGTWFADRDASFVVSADGGASLRGDFGGSPIRAKYPAVAPAPFPGTPGLGGMGLVQLMAPSGDNSDGTNTVLDDHIHVIDQDGVTRLLGADKQRFLGWAGIRGHDDAGQPVPDYGGGGDLRPQPVLLPAPFGRWSRARTRWIWTGATVRRELDAPDGLPRALVVDRAAGLVAGPEYSFAGLVRSGGEVGLLAWNPTTGNLEPPTALRGLPLAEAVPLGQDFLGRSVHRLLLQAPQLPAPDNRLAHHRALLRDRFGARLGEFRILAHDRTQLLLDPDDGELPAQAVTVDVVARFVGVWTGVERGLGATVPDPAGRRPRANVRLGFAFHRSPLAPDLSVPGLDRNRYPQGVDQFVHDLADPAVQRALRDLHYEYVQADLRFDLDTTGSALELDPPRPELRWILLPYRF